MRKFVSLAFYCAWLSEKVGEREIIWVGLFLLDFQGSNMMLHGGAERSTDREGLLVHSSERESRLKLKSKVGDGSGDEGFCVQ